MQGANVAAMRAGGRHKKGALREQAFSACHDNILPLGDASAPHPAAHFPEVAAALAGLQDVGGLRWPDAHDGPRADVFEWLQAWFSFQEGSVRNQREHLVLLLANTQMRLQPAGPPAGLDDGVVHTVFNRVTANYQSYCSFLRKDHSLGLAVEYTRRKELLYTALYLLIWGEAANLRFLPECLCYIFHHMAVEMNFLLANAPALAARGPSYQRSPYGFLDNIVAPIYSVLKAESDSNKGGRIPHSEWRNYDDFNEYFWNPDCFVKLGWPMKLDSAFFVKPGERGRKVGKTGFVEQRSFLHLFRSFDRHWVLLITAFQAMVIIAWNTDGKALWHEVRSQDVLADLLTCFITWAVIRLVVACMDIILHWRLVGRESLLVGVRMVLKAVVAVAWIIILTIFYSLMVLRRDKDGHWSPAAQSRFRAMLLAVAVFLVPQALGLLMFLTPPLSRAFETSNWLVLRPITWWFRSHLFVGRGLRESFYDTAKYLLFWILLLGAKFTFSYYLQVQPLVHPTKQILDLQGIKYKWHQFSKDHNYTAVVALWAPVTLVYLMDVQIWYSVLSSIVGALVGVFSHIGEVHNVKFLIMRFQSLPRAVMFNLLAPEARAGDRRPWSFSSWVAPMRRWFGALAVRYAHVLGVRPKASDEKKTHVRFAQIWNEIMASFREEDLLSNREEELLRVPTSTWPFSVPQWPSVLISNELSVALDKAWRWERSSSSRLWHWIKGNEFRRCAVVESYESLKHVLLQIIAADRERVMVQRMLEVVDAAAKTAAGGKGRTEHDFVTSFRLAALPAVHAKAVALVAALLKRPGAQEAPKIVDALQALHEVVVHDFMSADTVELLRHDAVFPPASSTPLYWDALELPESEEAYFRQLRRLHTMLTAVDPMFSTPKNLEARRRISFFCNSMFEDMPQAPQVEEMRAFSVLTPYYKETVNFNKKELQDENEDGISVLYYLQKIYPDEWDNFVERVGGTEKQLWQTDEARQLRTWASYRGQTLARCVRGMMYYRRALELLALLDSSTVEEEGFQELVEATSSATASAAVAAASRSRSGRSRAFASQTRALADIKFTYVVSCQMYADQKAKREPQAQEILELMREYEALRVAFEDQRPAEGGGGGTDHFSVLVKCDHVTGVEQEVYRVKLPGPMKVGEGKPENQNHAIIFTRGDALQTIDMNQDNYLEEALKMRNLLCEFGRHYGGRPPTLLGVREHVFTGSVSSLASFMSAQEMAFVTLGQRVLANPLRVRMHYGHPDVFDRLWFVTRGGISKASKTINISEDIFAGFNCTLRGGSVTHHEYIQVGKGRDVGLNQIALFEAKVASGNGEQVLSRDMYRLGHRLDPFRSLSFYYTSVGFYAATMLTVLTVYAFLWGRCYLALSGVETAIDSATNVFRDKALNTALNQQFIVQLGVFTALPLVVELTLEKGFAAAVWEFVLMQLQLASLFFTFSLGTRTHYFGRTILHGGAKYRSTGRGFVVRREKFPDIFRMYAHSHFIKAAELFALLVVYMTYTAIPSSTLYLLVTLSAWTLTLTWLTAPFIFNPSGFDWVKAVDDYREFVEWLWFKEGLLAGEAKSWEVWWLAEIDHLATTGTWGLMAEAVLCLRFFFFQYGIVYHLKIASHNTSLWVYAVSWVSVVLALLAYAALSVGNTKYGSTQHLKYRGIQCAVLVVFVTLLGLGLGFTEFGITDLLISILAFVPTGWALLQLSLVVHALFPSLKLPTPRKSTERWGWSITVEVARLYYWALGTLTWLPMAVLSWLPGLQDMQTRILFNQAFSRGLQISRIVNGKRTNVGS